MKEEFKCKLIEHYKHSYRHAECDCQPLSCYVFCHVDGHWRFPVLAIDWHNFPRFICRQFKSFLFSFSFFSTSALEVCLRFSVYIFTWIWHSFVKVTSTVNNSLKIQITLNCTVFTIVCFINMNIPHDFWNDWVLNVPAHILTSEFFPLRLNIKTNEFYELLRLIMVWLDLDTNPVLVGREDGSRWRAHRLLPSWNRSLL